MSNIVKAQKVSLTQRLSAAVKAFQMQFTGYGSGQNNWLVEFINGLYSGSNINFAAKAGDLTKASLVMAIYNYLSNVLSEPPLQIMEADGDSKEKPIADHPAIKLLKKPNDFYDGQSLWDAFALEWLISGNPYFIKARNSFGEVIQLWWAPSTMMCPIWPNNASSVFISYYQYEVDGYLYRIDANDVMHYRNKIDRKTGGRMGISPLASAMREIAVDGEVPTYQYLLVNSGGAPPGILALKENQASVGFSAKDVKANFVRSTSGDERGRVFVSGNAVEYTKIGFTPEEMNLSSLRFLSEDRICTLTGFSKESIGFGSAKETSTYANVEQADKRTIQMTVKPLWGRIEDWLTTTLGPDFDLKPNQRFAFDLSEVAALQEDRDKLYERECMAYEKGVKMRSEARSALQLDSKPDDDVYYVQAASEKPEIEQTNPMLLGDGKQPPKQMVNGRAKDEVVN